MKLDVNVLRYLSNDDFRVLGAVEHGMYNHAIVPSMLIGQYARLKHGGTYKVLKNLLKHKLLHHDSSEYDGFRLTYLGYDFLAINILLKKGVITSVGRQIGVGKESDIFEVANEDGTIMAMKLHRLGRVSFRAVKTKRDYLRNKSSFNWLHLSRLAACKEFAFMKALEDHDFPVPKAIGYDRHCVVMSLVQGYPLVQVKHVQNPDVVFETVIGLIVRLAEHGLIHCDFNEFNIMIDDDENVTMIDFPQMVSVNHRNAQMYFDRDVECIFKFFRKRFKLTFELQSDEIDYQVADGDDNTRPNLSSVMKSSITLDKDLAASGYDKNQRDDLDRFIKGCDESKGSDDDGVTDESTTHREVKELNDSDIAEFDSLDLTKYTVILYHLISSKFQEQDCHVVHRQQILSAPSSRDDAKEVDEEESDEERSEELIKSLSKQREKAIASARKRRQFLTKRNSYKDKGGKSSLSSKVLAL